MSLHDRVRVPTFVPLVSSDAATPLFLLHPAVPFPWCYAPLVEYATWDRTVYAARGVELDWRYGVADMPHMVAQYLIDIRRLQPAGPYLLGGWSFGGVLAFEIACRLVRDGERIAGLIMFDAPAPQPAARRWRRRQWRRGLRLLRILVRQRIVRTALDRTGLLPPAARVLLLLPVDAPLSPAAIREIVDIAFPEASAQCDASRGDFDRLCDVLVRRVRPLLPKVMLDDVERAFPAGRPSDFVRFFQLQWKNIWLTGGYKPSAVYDGPMTIYVPEESNAVERWQRFCRQPLDIRRVPVSAQDGMPIHSSFLHPRNARLYADDVRRVASALAG